MEKHKSNKLFIALMIGVSLIAFWMFSSSNVHKASASVRTASLQNLAYKQLGKPYRYGASGTRAFDCSSFTQYVYRKNGVHLPRTAQAQYHSTTHVSARHARKGDLVFFGSSRRNITHVGLYLGGGRMIDAQNRGVVVERVHAPWWHLVGYSRPAQHYLYA